MTPEEKQHFKELIKPYIMNPHVQDMRNYIQHGKVTTYAHCASVTLLCYKMNLRFHLGADESMLIETAMLHDFYLYDWHGRSLKDWTHSYKHPLVACDNAIKYFNIGEKEQDIIRCHMWPFTFWRIPKCREAWILVVADKICSLKETLFCR